MKSETPPHLSTDPGRPRMQAEPIGSVIRTKSQTMPAGTSSSSPRPAAARGRGLRYVVLGTLVVASVLLAAAWSTIAQRELDRAGVAEATARLDRARATFDASRTRAQASLQALCRVLVEDPRLKSTLATAGMDAATVDDILADLGALRGGGFLVVLSSEGRVFAEAGARELRGLDVSASSIVKRAQNEQGAAVGSWSLGGRVMDLAITAIRYDETLVAYLVVGQSLGDAELAALGAQHGLEAASVLGNTVAASSRPPTELDGLLVRLAGDAGTWRGRSTDAGGTRYVTSAAELGDVTQSHRLVLATTIAGASAPITRLRWMLWFPPALVLVALLFAFSVLRPRSS
jgi:hypothetical protein